MKEYNNNFEKHALKRFSLNYDKKNINKINNKDHKTRFRKLCHKLNFFMKHVSLPKIRLRSYYEAVLIEFRPFLPHIEFLLRNAILKLGKNWSFTVICGNLNYTCMVSACALVSEKIKIIKIDVENMTQQEYSNFLLTEKFWKLLDGEKILIYQEDSLFFKNNIDDFVLWDYIGAPFKKETDDTPNCVGNGGFSLRTKHKMVDIIKQFNPKELMLGETTKNYMKHSKMTTVPEDVYFSKIMQEQLTGDVADWDSAFKFSSESVFNPDSFGGHQFWISNNNYTQFIKNLFNYSPYEVTSNLNTFLRYNKISNECNKNDTIPNAFDINLEFFCESNNINYVSNKMSVLYFNKIGMHGCVYHPKQLLNIYPTLQFYRFLNKTYVFHINEIIPIPYFLNNYLYNYSFSRLSEKLIQKKKSSLNNNYDTILLVFLGNGTLAIDLLTKIVNYKKINSEFNVAFCINDSITDKSQIKNIIKKNFDFYAIYYSKEMGTDITPTMLMYNDISISHNFKHILKFHTKTISQDYTNLTNYLLQRTIPTIIKESNKNCNCIGFKDNYIKIQSDLFNKEITRHHYSKINKNNDFVAGTIFYTTDVVMNKVLEFIKKGNYKSYLLNNLYENNTINVHYSPIHFLERLFGCISL